MKRATEALELRVIFYGVGSIGSSIARLLLTRKGVRIVGVVDAAPDKAGKDLGDVIGAEERLGVKVRDDPDGLLREVKADIAVHATSSFLKEVYPQLMKLVQNGLNVVSTCEELAYAYISDPALAMELDKEAKNHGVTVLGTGINPGFVMDTLPLTLSGICQEIKHIKVERVMDAAKRRLPFQKKIGAGLSVEEFGQSIAGKLITGHVGLEQSIAMLADGLGWKLESIQVGTAEPVVAEKPVASRDIRVNREQVAGLAQSAYGMMKGKPVITLIFRAYIGAEEEYDSVTIEGTPAIQEKITPCVHGDLGTAAIIANMIPKVLDAEPGLKTMKDLPIPSAALGDMTLRAKR